MSHRTALHRRTNLGQMESDCPMQYFDVPQFRYRSLGDGCFEIQTLNQGSRHVSQYSHQTDHVVLWNMEWNSNAQIQAITRANCIGIRILTATNCSSRQLVQKSAVARVHHRKKNQQARIYQVLGEGKHQLRSSHNMQLSITATAILAGYHIVCAQSLCRATYRGQLRSDTVEEFEVRSILS